jgi:adenosylcobyric acid synthase
MVCGTASDSGKSTVVAGLCRLLARRGVKVAPFKAQNMALNSAVTASGHEIGRAQAAQAAAAGVEAEVAMNPVLLKPSSDHRSQVVVMGRPWATLDAAAYQERKTELWPVVVEQLADLRHRFDAVICEGAGSPAEINLLDHDITNLAVARAAGFPAILVGDIDRGGVFASLFGTVALLPPPLAALIRGFVVNKFRGDASLLKQGFDELEGRTGIPVLGVLPWLDGLDLDAEDSLALKRLERPMAAESAVMDIAVVRLPRISNFTDIEPLTIEPAVRVRLVERAADLGRPDLVIVPGSKATIADLAWLRRVGLANALTELRAEGRAVVLGICGGYQMLGHAIRDPEGVESDAARAPGLALLPVETEFEAEKTTRRIRGHALGHPVEGYQIHHGQMHRGEIHPGQTPPADAWIDLDGHPEGSRSSDGRVFGTSVHGLLDQDRFRRVFLHHVAEMAGLDWQPGPDVALAVARDRQFDAVADALDAHLDTEVILGLVKAAAS